MENLTKFINNLSMVDSLLEDSEDNHESCSDDCDLKPEIVTLLCQSRSCMWSTIVTTKGEVFPGCATPLVSKEVCDKHNIKHLFCPVCQSILVTKEQKAAQSI